MATRKVSTPGATETTTPDPAPTAETENTTGTVSEPVAEKTADTSTYDSAPDPTAGAENIQAFPEDPRLDLILDNQKRIENKIDQLLKAGGIEAPKKKRWVQGKHGLEHKEV